MTQLTCFSFLPQLPNEWTQPRLISLPWTRRPLDINQATNSVHGGMCTGEGLREVLTGTTSVKPGGRTGYAAANLMIAKYIKYIPNTVVVITSTCVRFQYSRTYRLPINNEQFGQLTSLSFWWLQLRGLPPGDALRPTPPPWRNSLRHVSYRGVTFMGKLPLQWRRRSLITQSRYAIFFSYTYCTETRYDTFLHTLTATHLH